MVTPLNWITGISGNTWGIHSGSDHSFLWQVYLDFLIFSPSCCLIKLSCNCVNEEDLERATCHCTFESIGVYTLDKALFSQLQKNISSFWPSLDRYSLTIPPYYSLTIPPQIALTHHTSIPDPEMTWLLDTTLTPI